MTAGIFIANALEVILGLLRVHGLNEGHIAP